MLPTFCSHARAREREIAVRSALGAARSQIVLQLLTESTLLGLVGGALGAVVAVVSVQLIHKLGSASVPRLHSISVNGEVLLFTLGVSLISSLVFGLAPALRATRLDLRGALTEGSHGSSGMGAVWGRGNGMRKLLVISELALSVVLLIGAGLLIRSFARLASVEPGFRPDNELTFELTMAGRKYADPQVALSTYRRLWEGLEHLPGAIAAGGTSSLPL